jgi:hypothetical protein
VYICPEWRNDYFFGLGASLSWIKTLKGYSLTIYEAKVSGPKRDFWHNCRKGILLTLNIWGGNVDWIQGRGKSIRILGSIKLFESGKLLNTFSFYLLTNTKSCLTSFF